MKVCPFCISDIPDEALKCKNCGEWVEAKKESPNVPPEVNVTVHPPTHGPKTPCPSCSALIPKDAWACMFWVVAQVK